MSTIKVDTVRPVTADASLTLQGDSGGSGVTGLTIDSSGNTALGGVLKLKSSGNSITASDGTTAVLSESGGVVTFNNVTLEGDVAMASSGLTVRNITTVAKSADTSVSNSASLTTFFTPTYTPLFAGSKVLGILTFKGSAFIDSSTDARKVLKITLSGSGITTISINNDGDTNIGGYDYGGSGIQIRFHQSLTLPLVTISTTDVITATCALQNATVSVNSGWSAFGNNTLEETFMTWMEFK